MPLLDSSRGSWPMFGKMSTFVEGFVYYSQFSSKVIIHDLSKWFPEASLLKDVHNIILLLAGLLSFILGYLADDTVGKYNMVLGTYVFALIAPSLGLLAIHFPGISMHWRTNLFVTSLYLWFPVYSIEATRVALISEQFKLPQSLRSLKMFYFCFMLSRYGGSGVSGVILHTEQNFGSDTMQLTIKITILLVVVVSYTLLLLAARDQIRKKRVQFGVVDSVAACIASALYNRAFARKKMAVNAKWIDYSDAKHYKETKDSALQLVQMSLIFLPFSLFFGMNEYMDVIWLEQNDWIERNGTGFFSTLSMITIYHAVDVLLIPAFEYIIEFVAPRKCKLILTDLQLIGCAIFLLGLAYLSTTLLQSRIENGHVPRDPGSAPVEFYNSANTSVSINISPHLTATVKPGGLFEFVDLRSLNFLSHSKTFDVHCKIRYNGERGRELSTKLSAVAGSTSSYIINDKGISTVNVVKLESSDTIFEIVSGVQQPPNVVARLKQLKVHEDHHSSHVSSVDNFNITVPKRSNMMRRKISKGVWRIRLYRSEKLQRELNFTANPKTTYTVFVYGAQENITFAFTASNSAQSVHIWMALPQIMLRSLADGIGKISTYYFTYTQSPRKLRATTFGVLYFAQYSIPGIIGMLSSVWKQGLTSFVLSLYSFIVFLALLLFMYFALRYEEI